MSAINDALQDEVRRVSDQAIGAVATMAQYEAFWGEKNSKSSAHKVHMQGLVELVRNKGGLQTLGLDGLLERIVVSIDYHASRSTGSEMFFSSISSSPNMT